MVGTKPRLTAYVRPSGDSNAEWTELSTTPGDIEVQPGQDLGLKPVDPSFSDYTLAQLALF